VNPSAKGAGGWALICVAPAVVWTLCIFGAGALPVGPPTPASLTDKWLHAICFGLYVPWLVLADRYLWPAREWPARILYCAGASSVVGMLLEFWQLLWPSRSFELLDWVADTVGAVVVAGLMLAGYAVVLRHASGGAPERVPPNA
jgi:VanZ family protein